MIDRGGPLKGGAGEEQNRAKRRRHTCGAGDGHSRTKRRLRAAASTRTMTVRIGDCGPAA
ncbi:MAG: hypothetical protein BAA02_00540 [Paenibacillaceae bacterium ZCTH02-B3]|nr:MAG: hypothetical protein BAA02_00540 [Paenibacillaceae bacterium ZCTH02-B3]